MSAAFRLVAAGSILCLGLAACGGGGTAEEEPVNTDYTSLRVADSQDAPLVYARNEEQLLRPLRNGLRLRVGQVFVALPSDLAQPSATTQLQHSTTNVQVQGVDEADSVKYDGQYIYAVRPQVVAASSAHVSENVLSIARTDPTNALVEPISNYVIPGEQSTAPQLYQLPTHEGTAEYLVAVSQNYQAWYGVEPLLAALVVHPDRTTIQVLDVRDPHHVSESWRLELDGWMRASRLSGDTLYVVNSYHPRLPDLVLPTNSHEAREINERRIRSASARELLPAVRENGGNRRTLAFADGCLLPQNLESHHSYLDLIVITAINVRTRRVTDVNCLSTNVNAVYMSRESLYVSGSGWRPQENVPITVLHKFSIEDGDIRYRASGAVMGYVGWSNPSYFMDEHEGDLRILTTAQGAHQLSVLRESGSQNLVTLAKLPNAARPGAIGKPGEAVFAVRFMGDRAYVVTFRTIDPLYVIDLQDAADPFIAGELEIPGFSTYLQPLGPTQSELLLAVGRNTLPGGAPDGIKVELFDVRDIAHPQSIASEVFGRVGSSTEALDDPHALAFLELAGTDAVPRYRVGVPIHVHDGGWKYSGLHLFEVTASAAPQLHFQGVLKTEHVGPAVIPSFSAPNRGILHGESVFAIQGLTTASSLWQNVPQP
jgi:uncharacterized secreted protein with C-terminal beta-propeller domain